MRAVAGWGGRDHEVDTIRTLLSETADDLSVMDAYAKRSSPPTSTPPKTYPNYEPG
jgi:hypothetical protein